MALPSEKQRKSTSKDLRWGMVNAKSDLNRVVDQVNVSQEGIIGETRNSTSKGTGMTVSGTKGDLGS